MKIEECDSFALITKVDSLDLAKVDSLDLASQAWGQVILLHKPTLVS